ncbi:multitransmembrane protein [Elysia marginata]|uniref:Multitransmembrane protein n=1 Tax=Elysia marginata TaxID=1093978 RepID=A0AAV4HDF7_9GAST|nr:multitransmembrane protein [Elysia marginata]
MDIATSRSIFNTTNLQLAFDEEKDVAVSSGKIISDSLREKYELIVGYWVVFFVSALGVITNSLVMVVFIRQGFRDSVNVSLFSIAVWDQIKCVAGVVYRLYGPIGLVDSVSGVTWRWASRPVLVYLPIFAGYVSYGMATYVSIERCLSVSMPFKVKSLVNPRLTTGAMVVLSVFILGSFSPVFFVYTVTYTFNSYYNASIPRVTAGVLYFAEGGVILKLYKYLGIIYPAIFCTAMTLSSAIIVYHLRRSAANFRPDKGKDTEGDAFCSTSAKMSARDVKVTKMLLVVILVYMMDFFPRLCVYLASLVEPEFFVYKRLHNLMRVTSNTLWVLDFLNASVNFFIFMGMSTNFKTTFKKTFQCCKP